MADITLTPIVPTMPSTEWGWLSPSASNRYLFTTAGNCILFVHNGGGSDVEVTLERFGTYDGEAVDNRVVIVGAGDRVAIGLFDPSVYAIKAGDGRGKTRFSFDAVASVTCQVFALR